jgi:hypothetical protein
MGCRRCTAAVCKCQSPSPAGRSAAIRDSNKSAVEQVTDGFSAKATVSADGKRTSTVRLYGLEESQGAEWLNFVRHNGLNRNRVFVHGMLTYDTLTIE